jgi:hypothetical protein
MLRTEKFEFGNLSAKSAVPYLINFDFCLFNIVEASNAPTPPPIGSPADGTIISTAEKASGLPPVSDDLIEQMPPPTPPPIDSPADLDRMPPPPPPIDSPAKVAEMHYRPHISVLDIEASNAKASNAEASNAEASNAKASNAEDRVIPGEPDDDNNQEELPEKLAEGKIFIPKSISVPYLIKFDFSRLYYLERIPDQRSERGTTGSKIVPR